MSSRATPNTVGRVIWILTPTPNVAIDIDAAIQTGNISVRMAGAIGGPDTGPVGTTDQATICDVKKDDA
jgi:hypothetical protein